jgi:hypothetical protein
MNKNYQKNSVMFENVIVSSKINGDVYRGNILEEKDIDGKPFWVFSSVERPNSPRFLAKEFFTIKKSKI